jgi:hypothetical protein
MFLGFKDLTCDHDGCQAGKGMNVSGIDAAQLDTEAETIADAAEYARTEGWVVDELAERCWCPDHADQGRDVLNHNPDRKDEALRQALHGTEIGNGWKVSHEYPGFICISGRHENGWSCCFYATPNWDGADCLDISYEELDEDGCPAGDQQGVTTIRVQWTGDLTLDIAIWRALVLPAMVEWIRAQRGDWTDV